MFCFFEFGAINNFFLDALSIKCSLYGCSLSSGRRVTLDLRHFAWEVPLATGLTLHFITPPYGITANKHSSADATIAAQATGAMSWAFVTALKKNPQQSYVQLLNSIRDELSTRYSQKPQLSCSHPLNTNLLFVM
jgi:hypothetical protein